MKEKEEVKITIVKQTIDGMEIYKAVENDVVIDYNTNYGSLLFSLWEKE